MTYLIDADWGCQSGMVLNPHYVQNGWGGNGDRDLLSELILDTQKFVIVGVWMKYLLDDLVECGHDLL